MPDHVDILVALRERAGWSQAELARRSGLSQSAISKIEQREREPSIDSYLALVGAFGLSVDLTPRAPLSAARQSLAAALLTLDDDDIGRLARLARAISHVPSAMLEGLLLMAEDRMVRKTG